MTVLELRDVSKAYGQGAGRVEALRQVDLTVGSGGMVAVMAAEVAVSDRPQSCRSRSRTGR